MRNRAGPFRGRTSSSPSSSSSLFTSAENRLNTQSALSDLYNKQGFIRLLLLAALALLAFCFLCIIGLFIYQFLDPALDRSKENHQKIREIMNEMNTSDGNNAGNHTVMNGTNGINCWDINGDGICNIDEEDINGDGACNQTDCRGPPGICPSECELFNCSSSILQDILDNITFNDIQGELCSVLEDTGNISCLSDVSIGDHLPLSDGDIFLWNESKQQWVNERLDSHINPPPPPPPPIDICEELSGVGSSIDCLRDVEAPFPTNGNFLRGNGTKWVSSTLTFGDIQGHISEDNICQLSGKISIGCLEDVNTLTNPPQEGDIFFFNESSHSWNNGPLSYDSIQGDLCSTLSDKSTSINCLSDVDAPLPTKGKILKGNGNKWVPGHVSYSDLKGNLCLELEDQSIDCIKDVHIDEHPEDKQVITFDSHTSNWVNAFLEICHLDDVDCSTRAPCDGDILKFDGASGKFKLQQHKNPKDNFGSLNPPCNCGDHDCPAGTKWIHPTQLVEYICDACASGNRWLHLGPDLVIEGESSEQCNPNRDLISDRDCMAQFGASVGGDHRSRSRTSLTPELGYYIPYDITITAYGISIDSRGECKNGYYDSYVCWSSESQLDDDYDKDNRCVKLTSGNQDDTVSERNLRIDVPGNRYIIWGLDNKCTSTLSDWNMIVYYKQRYSSHTYETIP